MPSQAAAGAVKGALPWAESLAVLDVPISPTALNLQLQSDLDLAAARGRVLPPLQSVVELTSAFRPPERAGAAQVIHRADAGRLGMRAWSVEGLCARTFSSIFKVLLEYYVGLSFHLRALN
jgi:hypothetical protein